MKVLPIDVSGYKFKLPDLQQPVIIKEAITDDLRLEALGVVETARSSSSGVFSPGQQGYEQNINQYHRSSSYCEVPNKIRQRINNSLLNLLNVESDKPVELAEPLQFLKYDAENQGKFLPHTDSAYFDSSGAFHYTSPHRIFTTVTYLNSNFEGGRLIINSVLDHTGQPIKITPAPRMTVLFPSDVRFKHEVEPVTRGTRYSIVGWYKFS